MNRFSLNRATAALILAALSAAPAGAHHSFSMFDMSKTVTLDATVKKFAWSNPHIVLWVVATPEGSTEEQTWSLESTSPGNLTRVGWTKRSFAPGDKVKVEFHPLRSGETGGAFVRAVVLETGKEVVAPLDPRAVGGKPNLD